MLANQPVCQGPHRPPSDHSHPSHTGARIEESERILAQQFAPERNGNHRVEFLQRDHIGISGADRRNHRLGVVIAHVEVVGHHSQREGIERAVIAEARHPNIEQDRCARR